VTFEAGVRRDPPDARPLPESDRFLVDMLREEIAAGGPLTFARFMEVALTEPGYGYYATAADRPTRSGDFLTAPELHPIFGAVVARTLDETWRTLDRPDPFYLVEYGAGTGALAEAVIRGLETDRSGLRAALRYEPVEVSAAHLELIHDRLAKAGLGDAIAADARAAVGPAATAASVAWAPRTGAILANEFLDALPVHRVEMADGELLELLVTWDEPAGRFTEVAGEPATPALAERLAAEGVSLAEGARAEIGLEIGPWLDDATKRLERGYAVVIDYGRRAAELYGPDRAGGTLRAYSGQRAHGDPFVAVGRQDLTAHVDFSAVESAAAERGWRTIGLTTQAHYLLGAGLEEVLRAHQADPGLDAPAYLALRASVMRLLDPRALGDFRVLVLGRGVPADARLSGVARPGDADPTPSGPP
jgi:SAM-dependent MidA family methyltransferase